MPVFRAGSAPRIFGFLERNASSGAAKSPSSDSFVPLCERFALAQWHTNVGLAQLRHSASQRHIFACGSMVLADLLVYGFSALRAEKPYTIETNRTALPKANTPTAHVLICSWRDVVLQTSQLSR